MGKEVKCLIVGCGHRARRYADHALKYSKDFKIVGIVDPDQHILDIYSKQYNVPSNMQFTCIEDALKMGKIADCVINGTMDTLHIKTAIPFLEQGYDMLLEKPITNNSEELLQLEKVVENHHNKVMICHVLRYVKFYQKAKEIINSGKIGDVVHIQTNERVGVAHNCISFIRGKWNNEEKCGSSFMLAKCCHDIDIICWLNNVSAPVKVSSFGGRDFIIPSKAPKEAGTRCLVDCPLVDSCEYSAKLMLIENDFLSEYPWQCTGKEPFELTKEEKIQSLKTDNPHGICAYKTDADIVDHQTVIIQFENGSTATHGLYPSCQRAGRDLFVLGTKGELEGWVGDGKLHVRTFDEVNRDRIDKGKEEIIDFTNNDQSEKAGHFGGDQLLAQDFVDFMQGEKQSISRTELKDSINGHLCVYAADKSMKEERVIYINKDL
ncbi:MAG: Gfo/Idh/MocA family oxidoreductase [Clostridia bacterium]|nr:Gfo/Idh/MocA family oxidoreductase [Clostridia bacterium]